jgi:hypothetical protein
VEFFIHSNLIQGMKSIPFKCKQAVKGHLALGLMEVAQRIVIKFLMKGSLDVHAIVFKLQARFGKRASALRTVRFWMGEIWRRRKDFQDMHR